MKQIIEYLIIGSGFGGICMAIRLKQQGFHNFIIVERNDEIGGTWYDNVYPGAACDVQSHLYCYSFEPNPNWSRMFGPQQEIFGYMKHCVAKYDLQKHIQFGENIISTSYNEQEKVWETKSENGNTYRSKFLISCSGGLSQPAYPDIKGLKTFKGDLFHSAKWKKSFDLKNKKVAIIGTGASAIQIIPAIVNEVEQLDVYQRTPAWVIPKPDRPMKGIEKWLFQKIPFTQTLFRTWLYWVHELMAIAFVKDTRLMKLLRKLATRYIKKIVKDVALQQKLIPNYLIGCKRILLSNEYYQALIKKNVEVVVDGIAEVNERGILTKDGVQRNIDAIVLATGFQAAEAANAFSVQGKNGKYLNEVWQDGAEAYLGTSVAGFPNFFFVVGPNTGLGHSSMILMIEAQVQYILDGLQYLQKNKLYTADVKAEIQKKYNQDIQEKLSKTVWQNGGCKSWYQTKDGKNVTLWPGFTFTFMNKTRHFEPSKYELS